MRTALAISLLLALTTGCDDQRPDPLRVGVFVLTRDDGAARDCWVQLPGTDTLSFATGLDECPRAATDAERTLRRGADQLQVFAEYTGLDFDEGAAIATPTARVSVDGVPQATGVALRQVAGVEAGAFSGPLTVPSTVGGLLSLAVEANVGYASGTYSFPLVAATPDLLVDGCAGTCRHVAAVGSIVVTVSVPAASARTATLRQSLGGRLIDAGTPLPLAVASGRVASGTTRIDVPAGTGAGDGTHEWIIDAEVDGQRSPATRLILDPPSIRAEPLCVAPCRLQVGVRTGVRIVAPEGIRPATAKVNLFVAGAPSVPDATVNLSGAAVAGEISGIFTFTPEAAGTLVVESTVAGFPANTITDTVVPAP